MSALLESLLTPACRRECEAHDAAFLETTMRHCTESPRNLARMQAFELSGEVRDHHFTILRHGKPEEPFTCRDQTTLQAQLAATAYAGPGAVVIPRELRVEQALETAS